MKNRNVLFAFSQKGGKGMAKNAFFMFLCSTLAILMSSFLLCNPALAGGQRISAGDSHTVAIKPDGTLWYWGEDSTAWSLLPVQIGSDNNWMAVSAGEDYTLALKADGTLWAWGEDSFGQLGDGTTTYSIISPVQIGSDNKWVTITAGARHSLGLKADGTLWAWGSNSSGQLGDGTYTERHVPIQIGSDNNWVTISSQTYCSEALKSDGTLWIWGDCPYGGPYYVPRPSPVQVGSDKNWVAVSTGGNYISTLALKADGTLWAWGANDNGQLGDGSTVDINTPIQVGSDNNWVSVSAGISYNLALKADGTLWAWGANNYGQLGDGSTVDRHTPVQIGSDNNWIAVTADTHSVALKADGTLWAWGSNNLGQLGDGSTTDSHSPIHVGDEYQQVTVAAGGSHTLTLKSDGTVIAWGMNDSGQTDVPTGLNNVKAIAAGMSYSVALKSDGTVVSWGANTQASVPVGLASIRAIAAGVQHTIALKSDGTLAAWGNDSQGQTNVPVGLNNVKAIAAGMSQSVALRGDGSVVAWGGDSFGETDIPVGLANVTSLAAGQNFTLALKSDGTVGAWGRGVEGQTTIPSGLSNVKKIGTGYYHSLAMKSDGTVSAWGDNNYGQTIVPLGLNNVVSVAAGSFHTAALKSDGALITWGDNSFGQAITPSIKVNILPQEAISAGAQWSINNGNTWHKSSGTLIEAPGNYTVTFNSLKGWQTPSDQTASVSTVMSFVNATYIIIPYALTAGTDGNGSGTLTSSTSGVVCNTNSCAGTIDYGSTAVITANATAGSAFSKWSGCDSVSGNQCTVSVNAATSVTATFVLCDCSITPSFVDFGPTGGTSILSITSNNPSCSWGTASGTDWLAATPSSGVGKRTVTVSAAPNSALERTGTMTIAGQPLNVTQSGINCSYSISSTQLNFDANSGNGSINIIAPAGCYWTVSNNAIPWIKILYGSVGNGNGTVTFNVDANSGGAQRTGTVTIEGQTVTVTQSQWIPGGSEWLNLGLDDAYGVSADGSVVVGVKNGHAALWTQPGGVVDLGTLGGTQSIALGVSADGSVVVGEANNAAGHTLGFRWTQADGIIGLGTLGGSYATARGASSDGSVIVGGSADNAGNLHAFRWTQLNGMSDMGTGILAQAVSADGTVVVGGGWVIDGSQPFWWTQDTGIVNITSWPSSHFTGISADGNIVVGYGQDFEQQWRSFNWTQDIGAIDLGVIAGSTATWYPSEAYGISGNGNVIVGYASDNNSSEVGYRWSQATGMQTINQWLGGNGLNASGVESYIVRAVSADGNTVVGAGSGGAFRARVVSGQYFLAAYTSGIWNATLSSTTPGVTCTGSTCSGVWSDSGASIVIIATTDAGYTVSWTGCDSVVDNQCTVVMNSSKLISANITPIQYSLTANASGNGAGSVTVNGTPVSFGFVYPGINSYSVALYLGTAVTITAAAAPSSSLASLSGNCDSISSTATSATCTINNLTAANTVNATFTLNQYLLTVNATGNGAGIISSNTGINYSYPNVSSNEVTLNYGTSVILTATASAGSSVAWSGSCDSTGRTPTATTCTINNMNAARNVTATFNSKDIWTQIPVAFTSPPALASNTLCGAMQILVQGSGNSIWTTYFNPSDVVLSDWTQIPGTVISPPALAWNPVINSMQMAVQGSGNSIWTATFDSCYFIGVWNQIPGTIISSPALAWNPVSSSMQMVVQGSGNSIWTATFNSSGAFNNDWTQIPGTIISSPALAWNPVSSSMLMVVQGSGNSIWTATFNSSGVFNNDWTQIPGTVISPPAIAWNPVNSSMQMVVQGSGNSIWTATFNSSSVFNNDWTQIPGTVISPPAIVFNQARGDFLIIVRGTNNSMWSMEY